MEGTDSGNYVKLVLSPGNSEKLVKSWGPLDPSFLGTWHHIALTLRTARQYSPTSSDPAVIITQAFLFIDGKHVSAGDQFKTLNLKKDMLFESGLSQIFVGGTSPQRRSALFRNLKGAVDNVRVWWPPCPPDQDPTKCNPYGFLYPQMVDGTAQPASGIHDSQVTLANVAQPVLTYMFQLAPPDSDGLLAQFSFDGDILENIVQSDSTWGGPQACPLSGAPVCPGCNAACTFAKCSLFDTDCVESGATDAEAQAEYAKTGTCQCLNVDDCPKNVEACLCPTDKGLHKVCTRCLVGVCKVFVPEPVYVPPAAPGFGVGECTAANECADEFFCKYHDNYWGVCESCQPIINGGLCIEQGTLSHSNVQGESFVFRHDL
jgi:hypothetical protein